MLPLMVGQVLWNCPRLFLGPELSINAERVKESHEKKRSQSRNYKIQINARKLRMAQVAKADHVGC